MCFNCVVFNLISANMCLKQQKVNCFIAFSFWRNVQKTSYKGSKVTSSGWRSWDVPKTPILSISTKRISAVIFSVLDHQMCVLDSKNLVIAYSFGLGKMSQSETCSVTSLGRPQNVNLNIFHKMVFMEIFLSSLMPCAYQI